jgi:hypothetical protein
MDEAKWGVAERAEQVLLVASSCLQVGAGRSECLASWKTVGRAGYRVVQFHYAERLLGCGVGKSHAGAVQGAKALGRRPRVLYALLEGL